MTPDFRNAVFTWRYNSEKDGSEDLCIPLQLQKLFGQLHLRKQRVVDTVALTKSFGWEGFEVFQQQDVQELTRVLFDALEESFKGTSVENVIDELYAGELIDYLRCIDVDYQSERIDKFLDFSLAIVPFGSTTPMKTLTECIEMFLRPEILDGENKYYAEKYDRKVDAIKGLKFGKLPQIMSVQLKRFVFDFSSDYVVQKKLNDQVKFPMILDMNKYLAKKKRMKRDVEQEINSIKAATENSQVCNAEFEEIPNEDFENFLQEQMSKLKHESLQASQQQQFFSEANAFTDDDFQYNLDDPSVPPLVTVDGEVVVADNVQSSSDEVVYESLTEEDIRKLVQEKGEWVYELYAVLIHSGAISGGHYYAYIKELSSKRWYNFNDSSVSSISEDEVREAWGGTYKTPASNSYYYGAKSYASSYQSSANAYMLMYRKVQRELPVITEESIPSYILDMVKEEEARLLQKQREEEELRNKLTVRVLWQGKEYGIHTSRKATYHDLLTEIWYNLNLSTVLTTENKGSVDQPLPLSVNDNEEKVTCNSEATTASTSPSTSPPLQPVLYDRFRLRNFNSYTKISSDAFTYGENSHEKLDDLLFSDYKVYQLETREENEEWEVFYKDGLSLLIDTFDDVTESFNESITVRLPSHASVEDLKDALIQRKIVTKYSKDEMRVMKILNVGYTEARGEDLVDDFRRLRTDYFVYDSMKLYIEKKPSVGIESTSSHTAVAASAPTVVNYNSAFYTSPVTIADSKALQAYVNQRNRIEIRVSYPTSDSIHTTGELLMNVDCRWKVEELRARIVKELQNAVFPSRVTAVDKCRLYKNSAKGTEIKDGDLSLAQIGLYTGIVIFVAEGDITPAGMFQLHVLEYVAKDVLVGVMQLPSFPPPPPPISDEWSSACSSAGAGRNGDDLDSIITAQDSTNNLGVPVSTSVTVGTGDDIDEDNYYETLTAARYKRATTFSTVVDDADTDGEVDNLSNQGNCDISPDDNVDTFADGLDDIDGTPVTSTAQFVTSGESQLGVAHAEATAVAEVVDVYPSYASAVSGRRSLDVNDIAGLHQSTTFFKDEVAFPSLQNPGSSEYENVNSDSNGLTPLSDSNVAIETANNLLDEDDARVGNEPAAPPTIAPSDFGEKVLKNTTNADQFIPIPNFENVKIYAKPTMMVEELRENVLNALIQSNRVPHGMNPNQIRLRERYSSCVGKLLRDGKTIQQAGLYLTDNKGIAVQILDEPEILPIEEVGDVLVAVQKFHRTSWSLSERIEVLFPGSMSIQDISKGLCMLFDVPMDSLEVLVVPRETTLYMCELSQKSPAGNYGRSWFDPTKETRLMRYMTHDMRLIEGDLLLLQNVNEPLGELTEADKLSVNIVQAALNNKNTYSWNDSTLPTWSDTGTIKYPKTGGSSGGGGGGIRIKTHKDRLKEQSNNNQTSDSNGNSEVASPSPTPGHGTTPSTSHTALNELDSNDDKEFQKQGGKALFSDLL